ncbi:MAG: hypothetical protein JWO82_383 [Akkermansiaceae bacterium]|nr:hypothetical protein [Akkermansiaceae bacterium]
MDRPRLRSRFLTRLPLLLSSLALITGTFLTGSISGRPLAPISEELSRGSLWAALVLSSFALTLLLYLRSCHRLGWKILTFWGAVMLPILIVIAFTSPETKIHLGAFITLLVLGIPWAIAYAEAEGRRLLAVLTILLTLAAGTIGFILAFYHLASLGGSVSEFSPIGLFQRGFLILFSITGIFPQEAVVYEPAEATDEFALLPFPTSEDR